MIDLRRASHLGVVLLSLLISTVTSLASAPTAQAATADRLPVTFTNTTGSDRPLSLHILGTDITTGRQGYVDANGLFHEWPLVTGSAAVQAPDVSIPGPANGRSVTLSVPKNVSGRLYYSLGRSLDFQLVGTPHGTGLRQPSLSDPSDPARLLQFDWMEFTYSEGGLWMNPTQVDQLALPATAEVTGQNGTHSTGTLVPGGRQKVIDTLLADPDWARTVLRNSAGEVVRVLSPHHSTHAGLLSSTYLDAYIQRAWQTYTARALVVTPFPDQPSLTYTGRTRDGVLRFTSATGTEVAAFAAPRSVDVWGCDGALNGLGNQALPNDQVTGPIARTLCAALVRGTLGRFDVEPVMTAKDYYQNTEGRNLYAQAVHAAMADGRAYAFAFDDVGQHESLVHDPRPTSARVTLQPLGGAVTAPPEPTPTPTPAPTPIPTPAPTPTPTPAEDAGTMVTLTEKHPGYATLSLGSGTTPGILTISVEGGSTSRAAVSGPGTVRVDLSGPVGTRRVTVTSTGTLGQVTITLP